MDLMDGLAVILPQLPKTSRMTCERVSMSGLAIMRSLTRAYRRHRVADHSPAIGPMRTQTAHARLGTLREECDPLISVIG